ncbi:hypothetical protein [Pseudomonas putida]|uniref:Uncharacterized protein n=1 Tax=Pseudomonas putida TaxID=303 RepID=A0A8I1EAJ7_PSEPU|nr:hypothetical protein [Pseudomonas putida]MBI6882387.1 hypothetical protein [Pseudomonas putida]
MSAPQQTFEEAILDVPEPHRYRWCQSGPCACMGGANCSGGMSRKGFTHEQWQEWVAKNPNPNPPKPFDPEAFRRALEPLLKGESA